MSVLKPYHHSESCRSSFQTKISCRKSVGTSLPFYIPSKYISQDRNSSNRKLSGRTSEKESTSTSASWGSSGRVIVIQSWYVIKWTTYDQSVTLEQQQEFATWTHRMSKWVVPECAAYCSAFALEADPERRLRCLVSSVCKFLRRRICSNSSGTHGTIMK